MSYSAEGDPYCYPGTTILRNLLDIRDQSELDDAELALFLIRANEPLPPGELDAAHYLRLHHHLFQDVYDWAGKVRTVRIAKAGNWFCYPEHIEAWLAKAFEEYGDPDELIDVPAAAFAAKTARLLAEINAAHPFREGNGRAQLTYLTLLAIHCGFSVNDDVLDPGRVLSAMIESFAGNDTALVALISDYVV